MERGIDPRGLCSICGEPFAGFDLQDDHVMPIGARNAKEGLVLAKAGDRLEACLLSEAPPEAEVFMPVPCAALAHARCNQSKGATRDIARWRHPSLPPLVVAASETGDRAAAAPLAVLEPSPETDWDDAQQEAYERGVEALRRRGHRSARTLKAIAEMIAEKLRLEREHRRADAEAEADTMIAKAGATLAAMDDWQKVREATNRIKARLEEAEAVWASLPVADTPDSDGDAYLQWCFDHDAAAAELRRWETTLRLARERSAELYQHVVDSYKSSPHGRAEAGRLAALAAEQRVRAFNRYEKLAAGTRRPVDRAKAQLARESLAGLAVMFRASRYYNGHYAKLPLAPTGQTALPDPGLPTRVVDPGTGEILR